jgi:hypothetical protein
MPISRIRGGRPRPSGPLVADKGSAALRSLRATSDDSMAVHRATSVRHGPGSGRGPGTYPRWCNGGGQRWRFRYQPASRHCRADDRGFVHADLLLCRPPGGLPHGCPAATRCTHRSADLVEHGTAVVAGMGAGKLAPAVGSASRLTPTHAHYHRGSGYSDGPHGFAGEGRRVHIGYMSLLTGPSCASGLSQWRPWSRIGCDPRRSRTVGAERWRRS